MLSGDVRWRKYSTPTSLSLLRKATPGALQTNPVGCLAEGVAYRLQCNAVDTMRTLEDCITWIAPRIHAGQILLLLGIGLMSAVLAIGLVRALPSRVPA